MNLVGHPRGGTACVCMCGRKLGVGQEANLWRAEGMPTLMHPTGARGVRRRARASNYSLI